MASCTPKTTTPPHRNPARGRCVSQSGRPDSNRRRPAWEAGILPTELRPRSAAPASCYTTTLRTVPPEPQIGIEPMTARLRIGCSTTELLWRSPAGPSEPASGQLHALARTRTATPFGTTPSRWRVYQFHHQGEGPGPADRDLRHADPRVDPAKHLPTAVSPPTTGATGLEPATSRVTVECSNQTELRPPFLTARRAGTSRPANVRPCTCPASTLGACRSDSSNGNRTRLSTLKGSRPNR